MNVLTLIGNWAFESGHFLISCSAEFFIAEIIIISEGFVFESSLIAVISEFKIVWTIIISEGVVFGNSEQVPNSKIGKFSVNDEALYSVTPSISLYLWNVIYLVISVRNSYFWDCNNAAFSLTFLANSIKFLSSVAESRFLNRFSLNKLTFTWKANTNNSK